jgi:hypothetical protein
MKHVWVLYFDTQIMILIFELSMSRCTCKAHRVVLTPGHSEILFSWDIVGLKGFGPVGASWRFLGGSKTLPGRHFWGCTISAQVTFTILEL